MKELMPRSLPARLVEVRKQFSEWRRTRPGRGRIPESLWSLAVGAASECGVCRTAKSLGLNATTLKKRVESMGPPTHTMRAPTQTSPAGASFLELLSPSGVAEGVLAEGMVAEGIVAECMVAECIVELEDSDGSKMRIVAKGHGAPDVITLVDRFWHVEA